MTDKMNLIKKLNTFEAISQKSGKINEKYYAVHEAPIVESMMFSS